MKQIAMLCVLLVFAGCTKSAVPDWETIPDPEPYYSTEGDVDFITEILRQHYKNAMSADIPLIIEQELDGICRYPEKNLERYEKYHLFPDAKKGGEKVIEAFVAYLAKTEKPENIENLGTLPFNHVVLTKSEIQSYFDLGHKAGWDKFYEAYPESPGIVSFSRPGFSKDGTVAVMEFSYRVGSLGAGSCIQVFKKEDEKWKPSGVIGPILVS